MPFTPTHIIAILPLANGKLRLPISALVVGSQIPDLPLYLPRSLPFDERFWHTPIGLLVACLPVGLLGAVWVDRLAKAPLIDSLPLWWRARLQRFRHPEINATYGSLNRALVAVAVGALTHVLWDNFTHANTWAYRQFPCLAWPIGMGHLELYQGLQYGCSIVLFPGFLAWLAHRVHALHPEATAPPVMPLRLRRAWGLILVLACPLGAIAWAALAATDTWRTYAVKSVTTLGWLQFWAINAFLWHYHRQQPEN